MISMMQKGIFATAVISLLALAHNASAQNVYYRWMDDRGNPVHSDRPPPQGVDYEVVKTGSSTVREVPATAGAVPAETSPRVGNEFDPVDKDKQNLEVIPRNPEICERAQANLGTLNSTARVRIRDDNGEYRFLTEEELDAQRKKAQDAIKVHCE